MVLDQRPVDVPMPPQCNAEVMAVVFGIVDGERGRSVARFYGYAFSKADVMELVERAEGEVADPQGVAVFWTGERHRRGDTHNSITGNTSGVVIQTDRIDGGVA